MAIQTITVNSSAYSLKPGMSQTAGGGSLTSPGTVATAAFANERAKLGVTDTERFAKAMQGIVGKRLTYRRTDAGANV